MIKEMYEGKYIKYKLNPEGKKIELIQKQ